MKIHMEKTDFTSRKQFCLAFPSLEMLRRLIQTRVFILFEKKVSKLKLNVLQHHS